MFESEIDNIVEFLALCFVLEIFVPVDFENLVVCRESLVDEIEFAGCRRRLDAMLVAAFPVDVAIGAHFGKYLGQSMLVLYVRSKS